MSVTAHPEYLLDQLEPDPSDRLNSRNLLPTALRRAGGNLQLKRLQTQRRIDEQRLHSLVRLGVNAMRAQLVLAKVEQRVVEQSPHAIHGVAMIKDRLNHALVDHLDISSQEIVR